MSSYGGLGSYSGCTTTPTVISIPGSSGNSACDAALSAYITSVNAQAAIQASNATQQCLYNSALAAWQNKTGVYTSIASYYYLDARNGQTQVSCQTGNPEDNGNCDSACIQAARERGNLAYPQDFQCTYGTHVSYSYAGNNVDGGYSSFADCTGNYFCGVCTQATTTYYAISKPTAPTYLSTTTPAATIQCCSQSINVGSIDSSTIQKMSNICSLESTTTNTTPTTTTPTTTSTTSETTLQTVVAQAVSYIKSNVKVVVIVSVVLLVLLIVLL